jgi:hypothetical protein
MKMINRVYLLDSLNQRVKEISNHPEDEMIKYEVVRFEVIKGNDESVYEQETHSAILFGKKVEPPVPIRIAIISVIGALMTNSDFTHVTCNELTNIVVTGRVAVPDRTFAMPIRRDDGRLMLFPVNVVNGEFEAVLNFPTSGQYSYSDIEANIDLPPNTFSVATIKLDVLRQPT